MAISSISICNTALSQLGANNIVSFADGTTEANLATTFYDQARVELLTAHPWNFAIERQELAQDVAAPEFGYTYSYTLPGNCLRVLGVYVNDIVVMDDYKIEGRKILTDNNACLVKFVKDVTDVSVWSRNFVHVLTAYLRFQLSYPITKSTQQIEMSKALFDQAWMEATAIDASQDIQDPFMAPSELIAVRY